MENMVLFVIGPEYRETDISLSDSLCDQLGWFWCPEH